MYWSRPPWQSVAAAEAPSSAEQRRSPFTIGEPVRRRSAVEDVASRTNGAGSTGTCAGSKPLASIPENGDRREREHASRATAPPCDSSAYPQLATRHRPGRYESGAWQAGKIRFAPLRIPLYRRKQTAAVFFHCLFAALLVVLFCCSWANPLMWPILVPYSIHLATSSAATDGKLSYRSEWLRSLSLWTHFAGYFPIKLHKTHDLPPDRKYVLGYHPHGIISHGAWSAFATNALGFSDKFPGITNSLLTLNANLRVPFLRDWLLAMGLRSVAKESICNILTRGGPSNDGQGRAVTIVVGGAREILEARPGSLRLVLKDRKGFVKVALQTGADLVPVFAFGENDLYDQISPGTLPFLHRLQMVLFRVTKIPIPALYGRGLFNYDIGLMPYRREVNIVVGKPIKVNKSFGPYPRQEDVEQYHDLYVDEVERLYAAYKDQFSNSEAAQLQMIS